MKLLQITSNDIADSRFNGLGIRSSLKDEAIHSTRLVWCRTYDDPDVRLAYDYPGSRFFTASSTPWNTGCPCSPCSIFSGLAFLP